MPTSIGPGCLAGAASSWRRRVPRFVIAGVLAAAALSTPMAAQGRRARVRPTAATACDRACLTGIVDAYLDAMVAHDPTRAPFAPGVKYTENTGTLDIGEGLWVGASEAPATFRLYVPDPTARQVGFVGLMKEFDKPVLVALRLRVDNKQITEVEHVVVRTLTDPGLRNLGTPRRGLLTDVPAADRTPRQQMLTIANGYYDAILRNEAGDAALADDCERRENGIIASGTHESGKGLAAIRGLTCAAAIDTHYLSYITGIDLRRIGIADESRGLVFALTMFRHRGNVRTLTIQNVPGFETMPMDFGPADVQAVHIFKITGGRIHEIEAIGYPLPYKSNTGWETDTASSGTAARGKSRSGSRRR